MTKEITAEQKEDLARAVADDVVAGFSDTIDNLLEKYGSKVAWGVVVMGVASGLVRINRKFLELRWSQTPAAGSLPELPVYNLDLRLLLDLMRAWGQWSDSIGALIDSLHDLPE